LGQFRFLEPLQVTSGQDRPGKLKIGFLHIGKTGGNSLRGILKARAEAADVDFTWFSHDTTLKQALRQDRDMKIGFVFRDPTERFVSAF